MDKKCFSVSMCVYGKDDPSHFNTAVESILNQTLPPKEVVLVVDGPVPKKLSAIIENFEKNPLFNVIKLPVNKGHGVARRTGLENCTNELVALMDADDISVPERFEKQISVFVSNPHLAIVGGNISEFVNNPNNIIGYRKVPQNDADIKRYMKKRCPMNQVTVMLSKSKIESAGGYLDWYCNEDYYLWVRLALKGYEFANVDEVLVNCRIGEDLYRRRGGWRYFKSEAKLQRFMLKNKIISFLDFSINIIKRLIVQVLMPNRLRGWVFQKMARESN
ncbi:MAG TPA: glycosyltransferase [Oscillospiraceae bacterium]|nr:glycosyltransferase [Oscillospiraceae bacterium]